MNLAITLLASLAALLFGSLVTLIISYIKVNGTIAALVTNVLNIQRDIAEIKTKPVVATNCTLHTGIVEAVAKLQSNQRIVMKKLELSD